MIPESEAQKVGHLIPNQEAVGSIPTGLATLPTLPAFMTPRITYSAPNWRARLPPSPHVVTVVASTRLQAKFAGAEALGCSVQCVVVTEAQDCSGARFGRIA